MKNTLIKFIFIGIFLSTSLTIFAQKKSPITGTSLVIELKNGFEIDDEEPIMYNEDYEINFLEMLGTAFANQRSDYENLEAIYAKEELTVERKKVGQISNYEAFFVSLESDPDAYQVYFGNNLFVTVATVTAYNSIQIDEKFINDFLSTIEFVSKIDVSWQDAAQFQFIQPNENWVLSSVEDNMYSFLNPTAEKDVINIIEREAIPSEMYLEDDFAVGFKKSFAKKFEKVEVIEEGVWKTEQLKGYRVIFKVSINEDNPECLVYAFVSGNANFSFTYQAFNLDNDKTAIQRFDDFLKNIEFK